MKIQTATYVGGPLDGQTATRTGGGRWPIYRDATGVAKPAPWGDRRRFNGRPCYAHDSWFDLDTESWKHVYRWRTS